MKNQSEKPGDILDRGIAAIRANLAAAEDVETAASRVLHHLQSEHNKVVAHPASVEAQGVERIRSCEDFRALIPAYLSSSLTASRRLLLEDHTHECVGCRKALQEAAYHPKAPSRSVVARPAVRRVPVAARWAWSAAAVAAAVVLTVEFTPVRYILWPVDVYAMVQTVEGGLYGVNGQSVSPVGAGQRVERLQTVRTGNASGAVLQLADGSRIEMDARSELFLDRARDGVRIHVNRGNIIVSAAKQRGGHLYAGTTDLDVAVLGTVFAVNAGAKGSRVTVVEGEVKIEQGKNTQALRAGQQLSTDPAMGVVPVRDEVAWSRDAAKYQELLKAFQVFGDDLEHRVAGMQMRHSSNLVPLVPADTVVFASLPNISQPLEQSYAVFKQHIAGNETLANWWSQEEKGPSGPNVDKLVDHLTRVGRSIGSEVIFAFPKSTGGLVVLADASSPDQLAAALTAAEIPVVRSASELQTAGRTAGPVAYVDQNLMVISSPAQVARTLGYRQQPGSNGFAGTPLYNKLAQSYTEGVGWLLAADLERIVGGKGDAKFEQTGLADVQQFVLEQKTGSAGPSYSAMLAFNQNRRGMAAWLAQPSPMGALEFISPNAYGAAAVVTKDPALMLDDILGLAGADAGQSLQNFQNEHRVDIRQDLAAPLGNEFLIAVDGPILPTPSWEFVIEVNNAARLQNAIEWGVSELGREAASRQQPAVMLTSETSGGRTFYMLTSLPVEVHYTFWAGYVIVAPSRALLMQAIQNHDTGNSLLHSAAFRSQLPADGRDYASGFVYQNVQGLASMLPAQLLKQNPVTALPGLISLYGETDRIVLSSKGMLGMNIARMAGIRGLIDATGMHGR